MQSFEFINSCVENQNQSLVNQNQQLFSHKVILQEGLFVLFIENLKLVGYFYLSKKGIIDIGTYPTH